MTRRTKFAAIAVAAAATVAALSACTPVDDGKTHAEEVVEKQGQKQIKAKAEAPERKEAPKPEYTASQENAIASAVDYLDYSAFSRVGLIDQLSSKYGDGFPKADAVFAVNHIKVDWNQQAAASAKDYLDYSSFSRQGLIDQLESEYGDQYTHAQAVYGVNQTGL